jgi:hypothetical protein
MPIEFFATYAAARLDSYEPPPFADGGPEVPDPAAVFGLEVPDADWAPRALPLPPTWDPLAWDLAPRRFVDGRDDGDTATWVRSPSGVRVPVRVGQIGAVVLRLRSRSLRREGDPIVEPVVALVADPFPWEDVERFARELAAIGFRLVPARAPLLSPGEGEPLVPTVTHDFERMRKAAQNHSNVAMSELETAVLARDAATPTVVDGRLSPRRGGFEAATDPVFGLVKTQRHRYLHDAGLDALYRLEVRQRTPVFAVRKAGDLPVLSWYVRFAGSPQGTPNQGVVRVEVAEAWARGQALSAGDALLPEGAAFADRLTAALLRLRCAQADYARAAVSLEPIVRSEQSLTASFRDRRRLRSSFLRAAGL